MKVDTKLMDILLMGLLLCAVLGGFYLGKNVEHKEVSGFFDEYIEEECVCDTPIYIEDGKIIYEKQLSPSNNLSNLFLPETIQE